MIGGSTHLQFNGTYYAGDLSGITTANIPFWFQHFYKPGKRISKPLTGKPNCAIWCLRHQAGISALL